MQCNAMQRKRKRKGAVDNYNTRQMFTRDQPDTPAGHVRYNNTVVENS
jgi:hypothetical protein